MVQVDVFWAYGLGASLAVAAAHKVLHTGKSYFDNGYFAKTLLFLSLIWAPTGMLLLLRHPSWETMQAAEQFTAIPVWLVMAFGITNITQGILGYYVGLKLIEKGHDYWAQINWMLGYFGMFFILVYGWDGQGYDRFFYDRDTLAGSPAWQPFAATNDSFFNALIHGSFFSAVGKFVGSSVFITLMIDAIFLIPIFGYMMSKWYIASYRVLDVPRKQRLHPNLLVRNYNICVFVITLGIAIFCAVVVKYTGDLLGAGEIAHHSFGYARQNIGMHILSYVIGLPLGLALVWFGLLKPGRPLSGLINAFIITKPHAQ